MGSALLVTPGWLTYNRKPAMPILDDRSLEFISHSPEQTQRLGVRIGELLQPGDVICLAGDLGAGKTTLAQGIARGWGSFDRVTSPSFVLIQEYRRADEALLYHVDAFRLQSAQEAIFMGLKDILLGDAPVLIEWPERVAEAIPEERLWVSLQWEDDLRRRLQMTASGLRYERLLTGFRNAAFGG